MVATAESAWRWGGTPVGLPVATTSGPFRVLDNLHPWGHEDWKFEGRGSASRLRVILGSNFEGACQCKSSAQILRVGVLTESMIVSKNQKTVRCRDEL